MRIFITAAFALIWVGYNIHSSPTFQSCINTYQHDQSYFQLRRSDGIFQTMFADLIHLNDCSLVWANANREAISAFSAVLVVLFTFTLWLSTHLLWKAGEGQIEVARKAAKAAEDAVKESSKMLAHAQDVADKQRSDILRSIKAAEASAQAAKRSAIAAVGVELPRLMLSHLDFGDMGAASLRAKLQYPKIEVMVRNYGRTPAFILQRTVEVECFGIVYPPAVYRQSYVTQPGTVVEGRDTFKLGEARPRRCFTEEEISGFWDYTKKLVVYGYVEYSDFLGEPHVARFYREILMTKDRYVWVQGNPPKDYTDSF